MSLDKTHAIIEIDSRDRTRGDINDFEIILKTPIYLNRERQYFVRMENLRIPTSFYNIDSNYNTLQITEDPAGTPLTFSVTVDQGNYTINELLAELKTLLDAGTLKTNVYTFTVDDTTGKVTILTDTTDYKIVGLNSLLNQPLGFEASTDYTSVSRSLTSPNHILMSTKRYLKINSDITSNNHYSKDFIEPIGVIIPITESRSTIQFFANDNGYRVKMENKHSIKNIAFSVRDGNNNSVDFNGIDWNAEMVIYEFRK
tara:strand:+ start:343 stop:1113 length:771 start_codon:yes stop_codon:yes gene_type:complete